MTTATTGSANIDIDAPPLTVYRLVSDITRMSDWSPECYRCEWLDGATGATVGARFRGHNRHRCHTVAVWHGHNPAVALSIYLDVKADELRAVGASLFGRAAQ